jgi:hypothetical protein
MAAIVEKANRNKKAAASSLKTGNVAKKVVRARVNNNQVTEARSQAKKIMQGLNEAEQIRAGKIKPANFEDHFG